MSLSLATEQEGDCSLSPYTDFQSLIQSERALYPSVFIDHIDPFFPELLFEDNKINAEKSAVCHYKVGETTGEPVMEETSAELVEAPHYYGGNASGDLNFMMAPTSPTRHSNPETPIEAREMTFDMTSVKMSRNVSEQSTLAARKTLNTKLGPDARPTSQDQNQVLPSGTNSAPKSRAGTPGPRSRVSSISGISTPIARDQAGPEQISRFDPSARFSNVRQHIGPSSLRNSISALSEDHGRPLSSSSQQYSQSVQANNSTTSLSEQVQSHGSQYGHVFRSQSPHLWAPDQHASPYKAPVHMLNRSTSIGSFTSNDPFSDMYTTHSHSTIQSLPFTEDRLPGNMTQEQVNPHRFQNDLLLQEGATYLPYANPNLSHQRRASSFERGLFPNLNMKPDDYSSEVRQSHLKYHSLEDARREKSVSTHNPLIDHTIPQSAEQDCQYVERLVDAMLDMSAAEDNAGMKRTWETMKRDHDKVEKAAWEILNLCKERHRRNGPFEMSPKILRQYDTFHDRVRTICEAMQTQKTLCKHLLRQPFNEEVVEDPIAAVSRIKNNRKVNYGKKEAIEKGREALGEKGHGKGRRTTKVAQEDTDEEFEGEDDEYGSQSGAQIHSGSVSRSHAPNPRRRQASSDDPLDQSYYEGPAPKKTRHSRSAYQLNEQNEMVDMSQPQMKVERGSMQRPSHERLHVDSNDPYGYHSITGVADARLGDPLFSSSEVDFGQHQQAQAEARRRAARR